MQLVGQRSLRQAAVPPLIRHCARLVLACLPSRSSFTILCASLLLNCTVKVVWESIIIGPEVLHPAACLRVGALRALSSLPGTLSRLRSLPAPDLAAVMRP